MEAQHNDDLFFIYYPLLSIHLLTIRLGSLERLDITLILDPTKLLRRLDGKSRMRGVDIGLSHRGHAGS